MVMHPIDHFMEFYLVIFCILKNIYTLYYYLNAIPKFKKYHKKIAA